MRVAVLALIVALLSSSAGGHESRPVLSVPTLTEVRDNLAQLEAPIITTLMQRLLLPGDPCLYDNGSASPLRKFLAGREKIAHSLGRYDYGTLEYPYTLPHIAPDVASASNPFPPGRFHQDAFTGNANISAFYMSTLVPLFNATTTFFYHLSNKSTSSAPDATDTDAALNVDVTLLQMLSNRAHIGKIVAEAKYAANVSFFTPAIERRDASAILTLLTNNTQAAEVLVQADVAASVLSAAWTTAGELVPAGFTGGVQDAVQKLFSELINITTQIEVEYLLGRL